MSDWQDTRDPLLTNPNAPHETAAVLRMQRSGWPAPRIMERFKISSQQLIHELSAALDDEGEAQRAGVPIHDATIEKEEW